MTTTATPKTLHRSDDKIIAGVCAGVADYLALDVTVVRILFALLGVFGGGGVILYLVAWVVMPDASGRVIARRERPAPSSPPPSGPVE